MTPYYQDDAVTIYHGDCREWMPEAEIIVTDPPYGIGKAPWDSEFMLPPIPPSARALCLMPGVWNIGNSPQQIWHLTYRWTLAARLINGMTNGAGGFGNWIPALLYSATGVSVYTQDGDCKEFVVGREAKPDHPSPKPLAPVRWFVQRCPDGMILDPFMGSGTTLVAAKSLNRRAIGIEIEERYCEIAALRCSQEVLGLVG